MLVTLFGFASQQGQISRPTRVLVGMPPAPVTSGKIWLIANRWGAYPGVLVATVRNGQLHTRQAVQFPPYWEQAYNYKVLVALSSRPTGPTLSLSHDFAYGTVGRPKYLEHFPLIYLSAPLPPRDLGKNWEQAFQKMGHVSGNALILPPPKRRTIRLEYPDGKPFVAAVVHVSMFGSRENHCGVPVGIELGSFRTDTDGEISFVATDSSLALDAGYYERESGGPAGTRFNFVPNVIVGAGPHFTLKRLWKLPKYEYVLHLRTKDGHPVAHARLTACDNFDGCGATCGPVQAPESSALGVIRFRQQDLRETRSLTLVNAEGKHRKLTESEMNELLTEHRIRLVW